MKQVLTELIVQRLTEAKSDLTAMFVKEHPIKVARHFTLDKLLPTELAKSIYDAFPKARSMPTLKKYGEIKLKYYPLKKAATLLQDINAAIQNPLVVNLIAEITGIKNQVPDPSPFAGGISLLKKGYYINPHLDNSHDVEKKRYRTVNVLYYVSPNWQESKGGNYELWDNSIGQRIVVPSLFNRILVMETHRSSWHAVNRVLCNEPRCCIYNYYFSEQSPEGEAYFFNSNTFRARPEQKILKSVQYLKNRIVRTFY